MEENLNSIIIPVKGLAPGKYSYNFEVNEAFFLDFGNSQIKNAHCKVMIEAEKNSTYLAISSVISGVVVVECDRCLEDLEIPIDVNRSLSVKFAKEAEESDDDDIMIVDEIETEIDLRQFVYDYICLAMPLQKVHEEGKCNPEMVSRLGGSQPESNGSGDNTPFSALKDLLSKK